MSKTQIARFAPGQIVRHNRFGYRGLIFDVDASFRQVGDWFDVMNETHPQKDRPWYHILVDGEKHTTYVSEDSLMLCEETEEFKHPLLEHLFSCNDGGDISSRLIVN